MEAIMKKNSFTAFLIERGFNREQIEYAINEVETLESFLNEKGTGLSSCSALDIQEYLDILIESEKNSIKKIIFLARYFLNQKNNDIYIYFTQLLGVTGVVENIMKRYEIMVKKKDLKENISKKITLLPAGSSPKKYPKFVQEFMRELKSHLTAEETRWVLAGNNHQIPTKNFEEEKRRFLNADSIDEYLIKRHERAVKTLKTHAEEEKVWFEQVITHEVVAFVQSNQEILSGKRENNKIFVTKIPYNPSEYIQATDKTHKQYAACHCPFIRNHLLHNVSDIDPDWCYCSGGFAKAPFEFFYGEELKVEIVESCLTGSTKCRFAITIPESDSYER